MIQVTVDAGVCGFKTVIRASTDDMQKARLEIESGCPDIRGVAEELKEADCMQEVFGKVGSKQIYEAARKHCKHGACPVPMGIVKAVEAACGLALPKDVHLTIEKID